MRPERGTSGVSVKLMAGGAGGAPPSAWRTPTPYIFLALAFVMGVIAVALLVLICMRKKGRPSSSSSSTQEADAKAAAARALALSPLDREPKVVVFMPGDHAPSFLASAKPLGVGGDGVAAV